MKNTKRPIQPCIPGAIMSQHIIRKGFTLIELLVVIAIIGILVSILLPSLNKAKIIARRTACAGNLRSVGVGFRMYLDNNGGIMPYVANMPSQNYGESPSIVEVLAKWVEDPNTFQCPADTEPQADIDGKTYFESEGSSYEYSMMALLYQGENLDSKLSFGRKADSVCLMHDYHWFHGEQHAVGNINYLFADGHVVDY